MALLYLVEAETSGAGSGVLPAVGALAPPTPPTLAYFKSQDVRFSNVQMLPLQNGEQPFMYRHLTDVVLVYSDGNAVVKTGHVPNAKISLTAGIASGQYLNRATFRAA